MPLPKKSENVHVSKDDHPFPSPLTTRNLRPRLRTALAHTVYCDPSNPQSISRQTPHSSSQSSGQATIGPSMQSNQPEAGPSSLSASRMETANEHPSAGPSQQSKRRRTGRSQEVQREWPSGYDDDDDEEVDQLEHEDSPYTSHSMAAGTASHFPETVIPGEASSSASSSSAYPSSRPNAPMSSPSLAKILHPTNIEFQKLSASPSPVRVLLPSKPPVVARAQRAPEVEPLSEYTCPICFFPPTNATLTPCGHICCGACLFTAVKSTMHRGALMRAEVNVPRCPVCRAEIAGWDGRGGGVIGLKPRAVISL